MTLETGLAVLLWAIALASISNIINARSIVARTINSIIAGIIFVAAIVTTSHIPTSSTTIETVQKIKHHSPKAQLETPSEIDSEELLIEEIDNSIPKNNIAHTVEQSSTADAVPTPQPIVQAKPQLKVAKSKPRKKAKKTKKRGKTAIYKFLRSAKRLVGRGKSHVKSLKKFNFDTIEDLDDDEFETLAVQSKKLKKQINKYYYEVRKLRSPNRHGTAFKQSLMQAAKELRQSAYKVHTYMNSEELENEDAIVEAHLTLMQSANSRIKELQKQL